MSARLEEYIKTMIADKERERIALEGELTALHSILSAMRQFKEQENKETK